MMKPEITKKMSTPLASIVSAPSASSGPTMSGRALIACPQTTDSAATPRIACTPAKIRTKPRHVHSRIAQFRRETH
jgi:hypothetical protein